MSARMFRRAMQSNADTDLGGDTSPSGQPTSDIDDDEDGGHVGNPFDLLGLQDEEGDGGSADERQANQQSDGASASTSATAPRPAPVSQAKRKKSKSKKKGKKDLESLDSIDKLVKWVTVGDGKDAAARKGKKMSTAEDGEKSHLSPLSQNGSGLENIQILMADPKHLKAEDELRRIFGAKVINAVDRQEGVAAQRRQGVAGRRGNRGRPLKKTMLVTPREEWGRWNSGLSMECVKQEGPILHFRYQHSKAYQDVQQRFDACVASSDPNTIVALLRSDPYHVDSLLTISEFHKQFGDHQQAAFYLEQCLFALESSWHPYFTPSSGCCRLEFAWGPNKALFIALFRHMQTLEKRGCHRTALEVCKFLLSLDLSDPLGAFFCIDFFAIRAEQFEWLERFANEYKAFVTMSLLPNFAFSLAIARHHLEGGQAKQSNRNASKVGNGEPGSEKSSLDLLRQALMLYPSTLKKIITKAPVKEDRSWSEILARPPFNQAFEDETDLDHLVDIYVDQNGLVWRSPDLQGWLKDAASSLTKVSQSRPLLRSGSKTDNVESVRQDVLRSVENEFRNMRLHMPDSADSLPSIPLEEIALYDREEGAHEIMEFLGRQLEEHERRRAEGTNDQDPGRQRSRGENGTGEDILQEFYRASTAGGSAFLNFLRSLGFVEQGAIDAIEDDAPALLDEDDEGHHSADEEEHPAQVDHEHSP